jgi:predicted dehydrogenase
MSRRTNRRQFLQRTGLAGVGFWVAGGVSLAADSKSPLERLNIACVGVGGKGNSDSEQAGGVGNIIGLCDIDDHTLGRKARSFPKAKKYNDFRKMLEELEKDVDAVTVSTPDHTHAVAAMMAMKMGKHVYCQKPLTHTVYESRQMRETARKMKVCTQMGNQGTASNGLRRAVELIRGGVIGPVREVHVWTNRPIWPQAPRVTSRPKPDPVPDYVHWDAWIGPAPMRPYSNEKQYNGRGPYHPFNWRGRWDFGTGALGDMACHTANMPFMALKLAYPTSVKAENGAINPETYPGWARVTFQFPARGDMVPVKLVWYEGKDKGKRVLPPQELIGDRKFSDSGCLLVGDQGTLFSPNDYGERYEFLKRTGGKEEKDIPESLPRNGRGDPGMKEEWARAIKENKPSIAMSNFDYAAMLAETILLGNVAMRAGRELKWDGPNLKFTNYPEANKFLHYEYRKGWKL